MFVQCSNTASKLDASKHSHMRLESLGSERNISQSAVVIFFMATSTARSQIFHVNRYHPGSIAVGIFFSVLLDFRHNSPEITLHAFMCVCFEHRTRLGQESISTFFSTDFFLLFHNSKIAVC